MTAFSPIITNWSNIYRHMHETNKRFGNMMEDIDFAQQEVWDTMNALRDDRFGIAMFLDDEIGIEDLFAEEQKNFEKMQIEVKKRSERIIVDALRLNIKSELESQTNKMFEELEEWRKKNDALHKLPQRKRQPVRHKSRQRSNN